MFITEKKLLKWALYCNTIYIVLLFLFRPNGINIQKIVITSFLLFSVFAMVLLCLKNGKKLKGVPKLPRILFYALLFWGSVVIVRGFSFSIQDWVTNFGNVYMALAWLVPIVLILGLKIENWNTVFKIIKFMFQLMLLVFLISPFYDEIKTEWTWLLRPVNFVLLIGLYHYRLIDRVLIYLVIGIYFVIAIRVEQRMEFLYLALVLGFLVMDKLLTIKIKKVFFKYILFGFIIIIILIFTVGYEHVSSIIASIIEFEDSRTFLYTELFEELTKTSDKLFGRGALGTYYSAFFENTRTYWQNMGRIGWAGDNPNRITTEVGYLQMILKGGFITLFLNVSISIYAVYVALFKSKNKFVKRLGYYILIISILSLVSFRPAFTPTFIIFWMAIGTVLNKKYRILKDDEVNKLIRF